MKNIKALLDQVTEQINQSEDKKRKEEKFSDPRVLTLKKGVIYTGRILSNLTDNMKNVDDTFVTYEEFAFTSPVTGQYVYGGRAPSDLKIKNDVLTDTKWAEYNKAKDSGTVKDDGGWKLLNTKRKQIVNFYLHDVQGDDSVAKEKIGTVVVLKYPAQLDKDKKASSDIFKIISDAREDKKRFGSRIFDLSSSGRSLIIKVTEKGGYNNYSSSKFDDAEDLGLTESNIQKIQEDVHNLFDFVPDVKPQSEIKQIIDEFYFGKDANVEDKLDESEIPADDDDDELSNSDGDDVDSLIDMI